MKVFEAVKKLEAIRDKHGDLDIKGLTDIQLIDENGHSQNEYDEAMQGDIIDAGFVAIWCDE